MFKNTACVISLILVWPAFTFGQTKIVVYKNPKINIDIRVKDLLGRMTMEEKIGQLLSYYDAEAKIFNERLDTSKKAIAMIKHGYGILQPFDVLPARDVTLKNAIQKYFIEQTRLGIPVLFADEGLHGAMRPQATVFPQAIAMASSWDTALVTKINQVTGRELRARGSQITFSPVVDIVRDPRWGRTEETFGEDTYLSAQMGIAAVKGLQGSANGRVDSNHIAATLKHFAGHGQPEGGINQAPIEIGERALRNFHLKTFELIIKKAAPAAIMPCYNTIDGVPAHANPWLLRKVLKSEWGYNGLVVSDWGAIGQLFSKHGVASNSAEAASMALKAGVDIDQSSGTNFQELKNLVKTNSSLVPYIDEAVTRVLYLKFQVGLFEHPYISLNKINAVCNLPQSKELAYEAACKSMVLLKNKNNILPLTIERYKKIAVIGPHANDMVLGAYSGIPVNKSTIYGSLKEKFEGKAALTYAKGCYITKNYPETSLQAWRSDKQGLATPAENEKLINEAVEQAKAADMAILVIGEDEHITREHWNSSTERGGDQSTLELTAAQQELVSAVFKTGKPVIVYVMGGRPLALNFIEQNANAIIAGWYAGQEGGRALASILAGEVNPSGKLPVTFPKSVGQIPLYYNHQPSAQYFDYTFDATVPLYPFGFGLSYTSFKYDDLNVAQNRSKTGSATVNLKLTNTGKYAGEEVIQLYIRAIKSSTSRPVKELKDFAKVYLKPGESKNLKFILTKEKLAFWGINKKFETELGEYEVMIGSSSADIKLKKVINVN